MNQGLSSSGPEPQPWGKPLTGASASLSALFTCSEVLPGAPPNSEHKYTKHSFSCQAGKEDPDSPRPTAAPQTLLGAADIGCGE
jgi:hypothetical protein